MEQLQPKSLNEIKRLVTPLRNANIEHRRKLSKLDNLAVWITEKVGTMGFFIIIFVWTLAWLTWNALVPVNFRFDPYPAFVLWLFLSNLCDQYAKG